MTEDEKRTAQMDTGSTDLVKRLVKHDAELRAAKSWALHYNEPEGKLWGEAAYALRAAEEKVEKMGKWILGSKFLTEEEKKARLEGDWSSVVKEETLADKDSTK